MLIDLLNEYIICKRKKVMKQKYLFLTKQAYMLIFITNLTAVIISTAVYRDALRVFQRTFALSTLFNFS